ncbi:UDP-N-acetylglucosamine 2-epimerase (non-hydrolyzing) [Paenibacillus sp. N1-5-1-14]|uniref:non-hydrolyzing UDP-N-acetylglucosamine 2-epimerase n=1 Tax=Paenibacillus radicibacter TaxID=2972488 RepID=UPI002158A4ED|nr:UDP-N-acetylglucosamine 2-epimerase (non-hydrolyzing) [Paenibacillus radicibacter]MCR8645195.1 UDP-N-acetylglucosamine 2-epimerase (non-hydrolyzing) [Paenibacillus radicibacter]
MKIVTILGTRPEIIRLSLIMKLLDTLAERHVVIHTGQNFTFTLSDVFFEQLDLRKPDYTLREHQESLGGQLAAIFGEVEQILRIEQPDRVLVLGDTNSALSAILAERMNIPVVHMEAGNRCYDLNVPEEKNRRVIDAISSINMPYTRQSKEHLVREGFPSERVVLIGNPIHEVLMHYKKEIDQSTILAQMSLQPQQYFLVTTHRAENVDVPEHLHAILNSLNMLSEQYGLPVICSTHPRTRARINAMQGLQMHDLVRFEEPFGFFDFVHLEQHALCVLSDSGTVQEECCIFHVPAVTIRNSTERPETIDCGSNVVTGLRADRIVSAVQTMIRLPRDWKCPEGYLEVDVSAKVVKFLLGGNIHVS